jgi:glycosyltransferase involved in cell wall biosynthesis
VKILFVTWDGPQVSYLESLFVPIFERLASHGVHFDVLQFRWGDSVRTERIAESCRRRGVGYRSVTIHRWPPAVGPLASALFGSSHIRKAIRDFRPDLLMPRSLMPALTVLAAGGRRLRPLIFDADGLEADERVDFRGLDRSSLTYRLLCAIERRTIKQADAILVRTDDAIEILAERASVGRDKFHVVSNGRDISHFSEGNADQRACIRSELNVPASAPLLVYSGSAGAKYRFNRLTDFAQRLLDQNPETRLLVLSGSPEVARSEILRRNPKLLDAATIMRVEPDLVAHYVRAADVGFAISAATLSTRAVMPTKVAEYLLCGVPIIGTPVVGDNRTAVEAGVFFDEASGPDAAADWFLGSVLPNRDACRATARRIGVESFSLERSVAEYTRALVKQRKVD